MLPHWAWKARRLLRRLPSALLWCCRHDCRVVKTVHRVERYAHSWFVGGALRMLYEDAAGVLWWRAWGTLNDHVKTYNVSGQTHVQALGGQSWVKIGPHFVCEYATSWREVDVISRGPADEL